MSNLVWFLVPLAATAIITAWVRHLALTRGWLDVPNARSSHTAPTARGGGVATAFVVLASTIVLYLTGLANGATLIACSLGGLLVATVGYVDDLRGLPARHRFVVHIFAAALFVSVVLRSSEAQAWLQSNGYLVLLGAILTLAVVWSINLFNFMDGIDGIAASQALFVSSASFLLARSAPGSAPWELLSLATAGSTLGFLLWNWPPARIFMGDVGSGFLGYWLAATAIGLHESESLGIWTSISLGSVFIADATITLVRRIVRGERWYEAHRSHAYQVLARSWSSHLKVTSLLWLVNVFVVLPAAFLSAQHTAFAPWIALGLVTLFSGICAVVGAGSAREFN